MDQKGTRSVLGSAQSSSGAFLGRCVLKDTLYTTLSTHVPAAQQHSCIWLFSKQNVISWDGIEYIPLQVICQKTSIFHAKEGCILIVFIMHSDQSHGKMEPNQYSKYCFQVSQTFSNICSQFTLIIFLAHFRAFEFCLGSEF